MRSGRRRSTVSDVARVSRPLVPRPLGNPSKKKPLIGIVHWCTIPIPPAGAQFPSDNLTRVLEGERDGETRLGYRHRFAAADSQDPRNTGPFPYQRKQTPASIAGRHLSSGAVGALSVSLASTGCDRRTPASTVTRAASPQDRDLIGSLVGRGLTTTNVVYDEGPR